MTPTEPTSAGIYAYAFRFTAMYQDGGPFVGPADRVVGPCPALQLTYTLLRDSATGEDFASYDGDYWIFNDTGLAYSDIVITTDPPKLSPPARH